MMKIMTGIFITILLLYIIVCGLLFLFQERLIFFPEKLESNHQFHFHQPVEELFITMEDGVSLNGLLFKAKDSKGLVFYLHGNAGSLSTWGTVASAFTDRDYDVFILDYRGYGKSEGHISGQTQIFNDVQIAYNQLKTSYSEDNIIVLGYSIGSGPAAKLASANNPKMLILLAPFYSLTDLMTKLFPFVPTFILKYKFENYKFIQACKMPVIVFHDKQDEVIPYDSSLKLKKCFKKEDRLISSDGYGHNGLSLSDEFNRGLNEILNNRQK